MPPRTSTPRSSRSSRRSSWGRSSETACVPLANRLRRCRCEQPRGERLLTGPRPGRAQAFEERAVAKQVEVGGVGVLEVEILEPSHTLAGPSALQPRQSLGIEVDGPAGAIAGPANRLVRERQRDEGAGRKRQPPGACHEAAVNQEAQNKRRDKKNQPARRPRDGRGSSTSRVTCSARRAGDCRRRGDPAVRPSPYLVVL